MGEQLQEAVPEGRVVKALNALWYRTMENPGASDGPITVPIAGNSKSAKQTVARLLVDIDFQSTDVGPIRYSREIESLLILWVNARLSGQAFDYYFRPSPL